MPNAVRPGDFIDPDPQKQQNTENGSDKASTGSVRGKLGAYKARADQHIRESMARLRQDVDTLKGYFRSTSSQPNTSYSENKSSVSPPVSQTGQPPTRNDDSYHHINKAPVTNRASSIELLS
ncbi:hypothetical protein PG996_011681 [Apiospora saccharicola]|uniref:Uncharacterized protein n=1 Tax=Apiospora saccharicola TaxID=335842 RepID=A0ABR1UFR4_9PEZI